MKKAKRRQVPSSGSPAMKATCHRANELERSLRAEAGRHGLTLRVASVAAREGVVTLHWMFDRGGRRVADYWPGNGTFRMAGEPSRKVADPREALRCAAGVEAGEPPLPGEQRRNLDRQVIEDETPELCAVEELDVPQGEPKTVCGVELNAGEAGIFDRAVKEGRLVVEAWHPCACRAPEAYRRWCEANRRSCVIVPFNPAP